MQHIFEVVVVGGGAVGASTAYHLAARGAGDGVLLLEVKFPFLIVLWVTSTSSTARLTWDEKGAARGALTRGVGVPVPVLCLGDLPKLLPLDLPTNEARALS